MGRPCSPTGRATSRGTALAVALLLVLGSAAPRAGAATDEPTSTPASRIATFGQAARTADASLQAATARRQALAAEQLDTEQRLTAAEVVYLERLAAADAAAVAQQAAKVALQSVAVAVYRAADGGDVLLDGIVQGADPLELDRRRRLASYAGRGERDGWQAAKQARTAAVAALETADTERRTLRERVTTLIRDVATAGRTEVRARADAEQARARLDRWLSVQRGAGSPILDRPQLTAAELASWYASNRRVARTSVPIETLAQIFIEESQRAGVRGDIAFAQSVLETAYFTFPDYGQVRPADNNFAGIGACDSCPDGRSYPDARTGVRAQVQLLRAYADREVSEARLGAPAVDPRVTQLSFRGEHTTWASLTGRWATAAGYGDAILAVYYRMLDWVTTRG